KKNPSALSNKKARRVVVRQNFYACRAPCRKVLSSGSLDRHTQYKRARAEKASEEGKAIVKRQEAKGKRQKWRRRTAPLSSTVDGGRQRGSRKSLTTKDSGLLIGHG